MKKILVIYSNNKFKDSAWRIKRQAKSINFFDKIIHYKPKDLPSYITSSPLMCSGRGAGCFIWKPYVIHNALTNAQDGDIIFYIDAGSRINKSKQWNEFVDILQTKSAIFFQYREDTDYGYAKRWKNPSPLIKHWCKPNELKYFEELTDNDKIGETPSLWGGFQIYKKCSESIFLVEEWLKIFLFHPELIIPPFGAELPHLPESFNAQRNDQPPLTTLVTFYKNKLNLEVLSETSESHREGSAVWAERFIEGNNDLLTSIKVKLYYILHNKDTNY